MRPHEFAEQIGVSVETLRRWDRTGKLPAKRTPSNHRYYTEEDLAVARGLKPAVENRSIVVYCRVSSQKQKSELANQKDAMEQFCLARGYAVDEWITEIGELSSIIISEIEQNTFVLDDRQLDFLQSLASVGRLSNEGLFIILKAVKLLPEDFDIEAELTRLGTQPVNLAQADENMVLSTDFQDNDLI